MKATIIPIDPQPKPLVLRLEFDSEKQYALFRQLFNTACVCEAMEALGQPALAEMWDGVLPLPEGDPVQPSTCAITAAIRAALTIPNVR